MTRRAPGPVRKGEQIAKTHGAHATQDPDKVEAKRAAINEQLAHRYAELAERAPLREADGSLPRHDEAAVALLADVLCRLDGIRDWIGQVGVENASRGIGDSLLKAEARFMAQATRLLEQLGMTPKSRADLGITTTHDRPMVQVSSDQDRAQEVALLLAQAGAVNAGAIDSTARDVPKAKPKKDRPDDIGAGMQIRR